MNTNKRLARLMDLIPFITQNQGIELTDLASRFAVSVDDLEKDLNLLWCCGLPGQTPLELMEVNFLDGFVSVRNADELRYPRTLTHIELSTLVIGLEILSEFGNATATALAEKLKAKLETKISYRPTNAEKYLTELEMAIQKNNSAKITYAGVEREIIPLEIYNENSASYLRAFCKKVSDRRTFKIEKILELVILPTKELPPNDAPTQSAKQKFPIKTHRKARLVLETLGGVEEVEVFSTDWLLSQSMALAGAVELLAPDLRQELAARARASQNLYLG